MKNTTIIIVVAIIALGLGYSLGSAGGMEDKKLQDSIVMMKEQSLSIQKMGEMMKSSGLAMQELGMKYKDEDAIAEGKDLEAVGDKYIKENTKATASDDSMRQIMK